MLFCPEVKDITITKMNNKSLLKKIIAKAWKGGWRGGFVTPPHAYLFFSQGERYRQYIFTHDFAKAFWKPKKGEDEIVEIPGVTRSYFIPRWQYHLQQMVLQENPIKYLEKFF